MKRITLTGIRDSLRDMQHEVVVDPTVAERASASVERMLEVRA
jgi:quinolinate synthase